MGAIILNTLLILIVALAIPGVINRTRSILAGRKGPRLAQHLYNVRLLLNKGSVYSPGSGSRSYNLSRYGYW